MAVLRDEGKILGIGLSHVTLDQLGTALPAGVTCVQNIYILIDRIDETLPELCARNGIAWIPYFPLGGGFGTLPAVADEDVINDAAARLGFTTSQIGLARQLEHSPNTMLISGTNSIQHLQENTAAGNIHLDAATMTALDGIRPHSARA